MRKRSGFELVCAAALPRCGDVDLPHRHHRLEGTLCISATGRKRIAFDGGPTANGVVELVVPGYGLAIRLPDLTDSVLFIELEHGAPESFHTGWWLSVYDAARAKELEAPAKQTFNRIHESMPVK